MTVLHEGRPLKIRLANIDAPEKKQPFGQRSKESLSDLCWDKDARYQVKTIDKYSRSVAVVTCEGVETNRAQVERGMAWVYTKYNEDTSLLALQDIAKSTNKGLWSDKAPTPPWEFRHDGKTNSVSVSSQCFTGPLGGHYRIVNGHKQYGC